MTHGSLPKKPSITAMNQKKRRHLEGAITPTALSPHPRLRDLLDLSSLTPRRFLSRQTHLKQQTLRCSFEMTHGSLPKKPSITAMNQKKRRHLEGAITPTALSPHPRLRDLPDLSPLTPRRFLSHQTHLKQQTLRCSFEMTHGSLPKKPSVTTMNQKKRRHLEGAITPIALSPPRD
jgi:hypothetical protein